VNHYSHATAGRISARGVSFQPFRDSLRDVGVTKGAMVLFGLLSNRPPKKMSIKPEPADQVTNLYAQYRVNGHMQ